MDSNLSRERSVMLSHFGSLPTPGLVDSGTTSSELELKK